LPAITGPAFLQTSHYIINVVTGIINELWKLWLPHTSWNLHFPPLEPETSSLFWLDTSVDIALTVQLYDKLIKSVFSCKKFCLKIFYFCLSWSLASVKSTWFKTFMSESIVRFKRPENQSRILKWKIRSVMEWKCSENINSLSGIQYRIFTRILQK
jgi:hypothetical protein